MVQYETKRLCQPCCFQEGWGKEIIYKHFLIHGIGHCISSKSHIFSVLLWKCWRPESHHDPMFSIITYDVSSTRSACLTKHRQRYSVLIQKCVKIDILKFMNIYKRWKKRVNQYVFKFCNCVLLCPLVICEPLGWIQKCWKALYFLNVIWCWQAR